MRERESFSQHQLVENMSNGTVTAMESSKHKEIRQRFCKLIKQAEDLGLSASDFGRLDSVQKLKSDRKNWCSRFVSKLWKFLADHWLGLTLSFLVTFVMVLTVSFADWPISKRSVVNVWFYVNDMEMEGEPCIVEAYDGVIDIARPPVDCSICRGLKTVDYVSDIAQHDFERRYAYTAQPVVITDGMKNWTASQFFSFKFFQNIYSEDSPALQNAERNCQFFPYKTNFDSLGEVFNMSDERAEMKEGSEPWYIGWSNCDSSAANVLRQHYDRPYFLPKVAESSRTDWIFMGSPGYGAHMHIDNVGNPSWQAQITGTKLWTLEPPPECYLSCEKQLEITVKPGEIIVIDTNVWYHSTKIISDDMSITIGSEYD